MKTRASHHERWKRNGGKIRHENAAPEHTESVGKAQGSDQNKRRKEEILRQKNKDEAGSENAASQEARSTHNAGRRSKGD